MRRERLDGEGWGWKGIRAGGEPPVSGGGCALWRFSNYLRLTILDHPVLRKRKKSD